MKTIKFNVFSLLVLVGVSIFLTPALAYNPNAEYSDDLVAFWKFDDRINPEFISGARIGIVQDETRNDNAGILKNGADFTIDGKMGEAIDVSNTQYIEVLDHTSLNFSAFTIMLWINIDTFGGFWSDGIMQKAETNAGWVLSLEGGIMGGSGEFRIDIYDGSWQSLSGTTAISTNQWHFLTTVYNGSGIELYYNSNLEAQKTIGTLVNSSTNLEIGMASWLGTPAPYIDGKMDEVAIYNKPLTQAEIQAIMEDGVPQEEEPVDLLGSIILPAILIASIVVSVTFVFFISKKRSILRNRPK